MGEEGRGIPTILEMGTYTRLDCVTGSAGMMRQAVVQAPASCPAPPDLRRPADRSTADASRARGSGHRIGSLHGAGDAPGARLRRRRRRTGRRHRAAPCPHPGGEILGLQARLRIGGRGHGGIGRQRLHRRIAAGPHRTRNAREFHMGGLGQHHVPWMCCAPSPDPRPPARWCCTNSNRPAACTAISTRRSTTSPPRHPIRARRRHAASRNSSSLSCRAPCCCRRPPPRRGRAQAGGPRRSPKDFCATRLDPDSGLGCGIRGQPHGARRGHHSGSRLGRMSGLQPRLPVQRGAAAQVQPRR